MKLFSTYVSTSIPTASTPIAISSKMKLYLAMVFMFFDMIFSFTMPSENVVPEIVDSM